MIGNNYGVGVGFIVHMVTVRMVGVMELRNILLIFKFFSWLIQTGI